MLRNTVARPSSPAMEVASLVMRDRRGPTRERLLHSVANRVEASAQRATKVQAAIALFGRTFRRIRTRPQSRLESASNVSGSHLPTVASGSTASRAESQPHVHPRRPHSCSRTHMPSPSGRCDRESGLSASIGLSPLDGPAVHQSAGSESGRHPAHGRSHNRRGSGLWSAACTQTGGSLAAHSSAPAPLDRRLAHAAAREPSGDRSGDASIVTSAAGCRQS